MSCAAFEEGGEGFAEVVPLTPPISPPKIALLAGDAY